MLTTKDIDIQALLIYQKIYRLMVGLDEYIDDVILNDIEDIILDRADILKKKLLED